MGGDAISKRDRRPRGRRRGPLIAALGFATLAHAALILTISDPSSPPEPRRMTIELVTPVEVPKPSKQPSFERDAAPMDLVETPSPSEPVDNPFDSERSPPSAPASAGASESLPSVDPPPLDLERSSIIEAVEPAQGIDSVVFAFRPDFHAGIQTRRAEQGRASLLATRSAGLRGANPEHYNAIEGPLSPHLKTESGCFTRQAEIVGETAIADVGQRWYRTACKERLDNPFGRPRLETDALGRAVGVISAP